MINQGIYHKELLAKEVGFNNEEIHERMEDKTKDTTEDNIEKKSDDIFLTQEIEIEEMAIDGICGVY